MCGGGFGSRILGIFLGYVGGDWSGFGFSEGSHEGLDLGSRYVGGRFLDI